MSSSGTVCRLGLGLVERCRADAVVGSTSAAADGGGRPLPIALMSVLPFAEARVNALLLRAASALVRYLLKSPLN